MAHYIVCRYDGVPEAYEAASPLDALHESMRAVGTDPDEFEITDIWSGSATTECSVVYEVRASEAAAADGNPDWQFEGDPSVPSVAARIWYFREEELSVIRDRLGYGWNPDDEE